LFIVKKYLDKRICDVETKAENTQTYREFIRETEREFGLVEKDLDSISDIELDVYIEIIGQLWSK
jgi:hypothetical protein